MSFSDSAHVGRDASEPKDHGRLVRNQLDYGARTRSKRRLFTEFLSFSEFRLDISSQKSGQQLFDFSGTTPKAETCEEQVKTDEQTPELPFY
jgi:hypothetical protein